MDKQLVSPSLNTTSLVHESAFTYILSGVALRRRCVGGRALIGCGTCLATPLTYVAARAASPGELLNFHHRNTI